MGELLPCPFCGNESPSVQELQWPKGVVDAYSIVCGNDECDGMQYARDTEELAIEAWNRRASPQPSAEAADPEMPAANNPDWHAAYLEECRKFQQETIRTSELATLLRKMSEVLEIDHKIGPWSQGCIRCDLVEKAKELLARPINVPAPAPAGAVSVDPIDYDEDYQRHYIPLPGGWEVQTKGRGSTFRIVDSKGDHLAIPQQPYLHEHLERMAREIHAACVASHPAQAVSVPEGWQLVPKEPTEAMLCEGAIWHDDPLRKAYAAMLAAAPSPPQQEKGS